MKKDDQPTTPLARAMAERGLTDPELARLADTSKQQIWKLRHGELRMSPQWARRLEPHVGISWQALLGLGAAAEKMGFESPRPIEPDMPPDAPGNTTAITEVGVYVGMGGGGTLDLEPVNGIWSLPTEWLRQEVRGDLSQVKVLTVEGDSMAGTLDPGDKVIVDLNRKNPSPPGLFVLHDGTALVAKRLEVIDGTRPARVRITSDNPRYAAYERTVDEVHIVGRIMARWERLG